MSSAYQCFQCGKPGIDMFGFKICKSCKSRLGLLTDETIMKHMTHFNSSEPHSYLDEVNDKILFLENDYIRKRIKLLHIRKRIKTISKRQ